MRLENKIAVVTGGGQGIGRAIARMFAREGARVVIAARTAAKLEQVRQEIEEAGGQVLAVPTDVGREDDMERLFASTRERFSGLDVLVNNAGVGLRVPIDEVDMKDYDRLMNTNLRGMFLGCRLAVPLMKTAGRGAIINISSVHGVQGYPLNTVYAATKGGIIGCTRALAAELAPLRIRVNTISPGAIWLESYTESWLKQVREEDREEFCILHFALCISSTSARDTIIPLACGWSALDDSRSGRFNSLTLSRSHSLTFVPGNGVEINPHSPALFLPSSHRSWRFSA
jgi:NAD(P)-dependent dehydrogenase (short-subunit alcohol dehydrogenase family)